MATTVVLVLVASDAVVESDFAGEAAASEEFEGAVDRREADACIFLLHEAMEFVGGEMLARLKKCPQDGISLRGLLQADAAQMLEKDRLRLADTLARND